MSEGIEVSLVINEYSTKPYELHFCFKSISEKVLKRMRNISKAKGLYINDRPFPFRGFSLDKKEFLSDFERICRLDSLDCPLLMDVLTNKYTYKFSEISKAKKAMVKLIVVLNDFYKKEKENYEKLLDEKMRGL